MTGPENKFKSEYGYMEDSGLATLQRSLNNFYALAPRRLLRDSSSAKDQFPILLDLAVASIKSNPKKVPILIEFLRTNLRTHPTNKAIIEADKRMRTMHPDFYSNESGGERKL